MHENRYDTDTNKKNKSICTISIPGNILSCHHESFRSEYQHTKHGGCQGMVGGQDTFDSIYRNYRNFRYDIQL